MWNKLARLAALLAVGLGFIILWFTPVLAADTRAGDAVTIAAGEVVNDDLYLAGSVVTVDGTVNGDVIAAGNEVIINGRVNGTVTAVGSTVSVSGTVNGSVRASANTLVFSGDTGGDLVCLAGVVNIPSTGSIGRDLMVTSRLLTVEGPVKRDIKCNTSSLVLGSSVGGNVLAEAGEVKLDSSAIITGDLEFTSQKEASLAPGALIRGRILHNTPENRTGQGQISGQAAGAAVGGILSVILAIIFGFFVVLAITVYLAALLLGIVVILLARKQITDVIERLRNKPWVCLGWGALVFVLTPIAVAILCMLIIGIPLAIAVLAIYLIALCLGHIVTAIFLGKWLLRRAARPDTAGSMIGALALGLLIIYVLGVIPFVSILTDLAAVLFGFGAICHLIKSRLTQR